MHVISWSDLQGLLIFELFVIYYAHHLIRYLTDSQESFPATSKVVVGILFNQVYGGKFLFWLITF